MTVNEFLNEFKSALNEFKVLNSPAIRLVHTNGEGPFCPITAVYYKKHKVFVSVPEAWHNGVAMGLGNTDAGNIIIAADDPKTRGITSKGIRSKLEEIIKCT